MSEEPAMSNIPGQGPATYEPVPVHPETSQDVTYHDRDDGVPPSPGPPLHTQNSFESHVQPDLTLGTFMTDTLPSGAARPRFMGAALGEDGIRQSYASSQQGSYTGGYDDAGSSVYALNPGAGARDSTASRGYASVPYQDDAHDADFGGEGAMPMSPRGPQRYMEEKRAAYVPPKRSKRGIIIGAIIAGLVIAVAVVVALYFTVIKKHSSGSTSSGSSSGSSSSSSGSSGNPTSNLVKSGGDGSTITMDDGSTMTYSNKFGGTWYYDPADPFNNSAQANSWTPPLSQPFQYGIDHIYGVNLGGWLVPEPFIAPALYEPYLSNTVPAVDEWTLCQAMAADTANGGISQLENHYKTFITEEDFAKIAGAGLNYVRIALGYWAIEVRDGEPFLPKTSWTYFLKAIKWARKYGIRINLDFHSVPGSQNGWNHSGKLGSINFLYNSMGMANAQRTLDYIRIIVEFISQPQYSDVVTIFGVVNEPRACPYLGQDNLANFYGEAYNVARTASGTGQGNGPMLSFHEGFCGLGKWAGFMENGDRMALDLHPYLAFGTQSNAPMSSFAKAPCTTWGQSMNTSMGAFGFTAAGEFSNAVTDCGKWLTNVNEGTRYEGTYDDGGNWPKQGSCDDVIDYKNWSASDKAAIEQFALASMDALQNWFFWTWKIGNSSVGTKDVMSPHWSYSLGLDNGWMPLDPRDSVGNCGNSNPWTGPLEPWQTGGTGAGVAVSSGSVVWPPASISNAGPAIPVSLLPTYTPTGTIVTLPVPSITQSGSSTINVNVGNGWANSADNSGMYVAVSTCSYQDPWGGSSQPPSPLCSGAAAKREDAYKPAAPSKITPPPHAW